MHAWRGDRRGARRRRALIGVAATLVVAVTPPLSPAAASRPDAAATRRGATALLERAARDGGDVDVDPQTGVVRFAGGTDARPLASGATGDEGTTARGFVDRYGAALGVDDPGSELVEDRRSETLTGSAIRYRQVHGGVPVLGGDVVVALDADGDVVASTAVTSTSADVDVTPAIAPAAASAASIELVARDHAVPAAELTASVPELWIFDPELLHAGGLPTARLVWRVEVRTALGDVDDLVLVDARSAAVALHVSQVESAKDRRVCDNWNDPDASASCAAPVLVEGGDPSAVSAEAQRAYDFAGTTYDFYLGVLGRDSIDGEGMRLTSTVRYCPPSGRCPYENAFWNGAQMVYGDGFTSGLDVVAHELTHGLTEYSSGLLYFGEAGAINESMSDVFGEIIELWSLPPNDPERTTWEIGEDIPDVGAFRSMSNPPKFNDPDRMTSSRYVGSARDHHGVHTNSGVNNKAAYLMASGGTFNGRSMGAGIGIVKTAQVYYEAQVSLLAPGSDYADLANVLPQACADLESIGMVAASDCSIVAAAVAATEMATPPTTSGASLRSPPCDAGQAVTATVFADSIQNDAPGWTTSGTVEGAAWQFGEVRSGDLALVGPDVPVTAQSWVRTAAAIAVPPTGATYLGFEHAFQFDHDTDGSGTPVRFYDGGQVRYSTTGSAGPWRDVASLPGTTPVHGYGQVVSTYNGTTNPMAGSRAFTAESPGWQDTRMDLTALAGQLVQLEWYVATDASVGMAGWLLDDVRVYQCGATTSATTSVPSTAPPSTTAPTTSAPTAPAGGRLMPLAPCRLVDTRAGTTVGSRSIRLAAGETYAIDVRGTNGRCSIPSSAAAVAANVTVTDTGDDGFLTAYPCDSVRPTASSLNYAAGQTVGNALLAKLSGDGQLCVHTHAAVELIVDVNGVVPAGEGYAPLVPARVLDTRTGHPTVDGRYSSIGTPAAGSVVELRLAERGGVPTGASAVAFNLTVVGARTSGFVTAYPCDSPRPNASSLNHGAGQTVGSSVLAKLSADGSVCLFSYGVADLVVDVSGWFPADSGFGALVPARVLESRRGYSTVDGAMQGIGTAASGSVVRLPIAGRAGVPVAATAVALNVTAVEPVGAGYVTVYPCDAPRPTASNLNHPAGTTVGNAVLAKVGAAGDVCLYVFGATDVVVDVTGWFSG